MDAVIDEDETVMACVRSDDYARSAGLPEDEFLRRRIADRLYHYICIDGPTTIAIVGHDMVQSMNLEADALFTLSLDNIPTLTPEVVYNDLGEVVMVTAGGDYEASLILRTDVWSALAERFGRDIVFGLPTRDVFLAGSIGSAEALEILRWQVPKGFRRNAYPISPRLYR
ncbi:MAG: hypothetical protein AAF322_07670 [Pseudomonadota bacterium]